MGFCIIGENQTVSLTGYHSCHPAADSPADRARMANRDQYPCPAGFTAHEFNDGGRYCASPGDLVAPPETTAQNWAYSGGARPRFSCPDGMDQLAYRLTPGGQERQTCIPRGTSPANYPNYYGGSVPLDYDANGNPIISGVLWTPPPGQVPNNYGEWVYAHTDHNPPGGGSPPPVQTPPVQQQAVRPVNLVPISTVTIPTPPSGQMVNNVSAGTINSGAANSLIGSDGKIFGLSPLVVFGGAAAAVLLVVMSSHK